jgi:myo-inositol-1-phosphate synthase
MFRPSFENIPESKVALKRTARPRPADGQLAVFLPGLGAVATTLIAGVMLTRRHKSVPVGSLTQLGNIGLEAGRSGTVLPIREVVPLAGLPAMQFAAWDIFPDNAYESAKHAGVLRPEHLEEVQDELSGIVPMPGAFFPEYVKRLHGTHVKKGSSKADLVEQLRADIRSFMKAKGCARGVAVWCGSTEVYTTPSQVHENIQAFEAGLAKSDPAITSSQLYSWACLLEGIPFANGSPNLTTDFPAIHELAREKRLPIAGKDFKTGQTLMKTVIAPALSARRLGVRGWYSTNVLGNRDGEVLDDADSFRAKEVSKLGVLENIFEPAENPELYGNVTHKVRIDYYPPRGDDKEGWDNIDLFGWLGYPMQMKINFLCKDSILAAPVVLDLALFMDLAHRSGLYGVQEWLSFYFKSPMTTGGEPTHDLFAQQEKLEDCLRTLSGHEPLGE